MMPALSPEQEKIVQHVGSPLRVLAGPGTGKTFTIAHRVRWLLEESVVQPSAIRAITFTNAAADEMRNKIEKIGVRPDRMSWISTLHAAATRILHTEAALARVHPQFRPLGRRELRVVLADVEEDLRAAGYRIGFRATIKIRDLYEVYRQVRSAPNPEPPSWLSTSSFERRLYEQFVHKFEEAQRFYRTLDWADVIHRTIELFQQHPELKQAHCEKTRYLMVDEYQDLNPAEQWLVTVLVGDPAGLSIFGDDDQSLYESLRFADPRGILDFPKKFPGAVTYPLSVCRRCPQEVIKPALQLIQHNLVREEKALEAESPAKKGFVAVRALRSMKQEKAWLVEKIKVQVGKGFRYRDMLVLFSEGSVAEEYVVTLKASGIPCLVKLRLESIFDSETFQDFHAYLRFIADNEDNLSLRVCLASAPGVGSRTIWHLRKMAEAKRCTLWKAVKDLTGAPQAFREVRQRKVVQQWCGELEKALSAERFGTVVAQVAALLPGCQEDAGVKCLTEYIRSMDGKEEALTFKEVLDTFEQLREAGRFEGQAEQEEDAVRVMTMHSAKGLEAPLVFIPATEDDLMPGGGNVEERRRLFYVALTRAKYGVFISWARQRTGKVTHSMPGRKIIGKIGSRFIKEMGSF